MKTLEMTMKVVEDRSAPLMLTERNLPGMRCCTCCCSCCFGTGSGSGGTSTVTTPGDLGESLSINKSL